MRLAEAQLAKTDLELSYTSVNAPLTGFVGKAMKDIGSLVDSAQNSLLTTMQQVDPIYVSFHVTENDYLALHQSLRDGEIVPTPGSDGPYVEIVLLDGAAYGQHGKITFEDASVDTQTGTVELRGTFENADKKLKPGQFVKVHLQGWERPNTLIVPQRAVSQSPQGSYVYVVGADSKAERRTIKTGAWAGKDWIVLDGVKAGEQVILEGLTKVRPGMVVAPAADSAQAGSGTAPSAQSGPSAPATTP